MINDHAELCRRLRFYSEGIGHTIREEAARAIEALVKERDKAIAEIVEARRRRDERRAKAEGYDEVRRALREKVGEPWPPSLSRILWAGIAADQKKRADDAEAALSGMVEMWRSVCAANGHDPAHVEQYERAVQRLEAARLE